MSSRDNPAAWAAKRGMFRTCDRIDEAKGRSGGWGTGKADPVAVADARTSMDDYRCALTIALGHADVADRNGYVPAGTLS